MLMKAMIDEFCARFAPGGRVLFVRDARCDDPLRFDDELSEFGVDVDEHLELPDLIVSLADRNWLILMQAASNRGAIDEKRHDELRSLFGDVGAELVCVSCFATRAELREYPTDFAWESAVWCADEPDHLIHFDGKRLLGPFEFSS